MLLSTVSWNVDVSGSWHDPANWDTNMVPQPGQDVVIDRPGFDITVTYNSGSLAINNLTTEDGLAVVGGALSITGAGTLNGDLTVSSGASLAANGAGAISTSFFIQALNGGVVDLSSTAAISAGAAQVLADGTDSSIDFSTLALFNDTNGNSGSTLQARNGGTVVLATPITISAVALTVDSTGTMDTTQITIFNSSSATVNGTPADFSGMSDIRGSTFTLNGGSTADLDNAAAINGANFIVNDGVTLALPLAATYAETNNQTNNSFVANGAGSRLDLSNLTALSGGSFISTHFVQARNGGQVDLSGLTMITGGATQVTADGADSLVDLPAMTSWLDNNGNRGSLVQASNDGTVAFTPTMLSVTNVAVTLTTTGTLSGGTLRIDAGSVMNGVGTIDANVINANLVAPGGSPGAQTIAGDYTQTTAGRLDIEITGVNPGDDFDVLNVTGAATLDGTLNITRPGGFPPAPKDSFQIVTFASRSGQFATVNGADLGNGLVLHRAYSAVDLTLVTLPVLTIDDVATAEGDAGTSQAMFTVSFSAMVGFDVTVDFATADGTATAGDDYEPAAGTATIPGGQTSTLIVVDVNGDLGREYDETFLVNLFNEVDAELGDPQAVGTIVNDDPLPSIMIDDVTMVEGDARVTPFKFTVTLSSPAPAPVSVNYQVVGDSATADEDFTPLSDSLHFDAAPSAGLVSDGSDGPFHPTGNITLDIPPDGIFNFTTIDIPTNVTVRFNRNATNTTPILLATGAVNVHGSIFVSATSRLGGPGGGDGGVGGNGLVAGGDGMGTSPGGGGPAGTPNPGNAGGGGGMATEGLQAIRHTGPFPAPGGPAAPLPDVVAQRGGSGGVIDLEAQVITLDANALLQAVGGPGGGLSSISIFDPNFSSGADGGLGYVRLTGNVVNVDG